MSDRMRMQCGKSNMAKSCANMPQSTGAKTLYKNTEESTGAKNWTNTGPCAASALSASSSARSSTCGETEGERAWRTEGAKRSGQHRRTSRHATTTSARTNVSCHSDLGTRTRRDPRQAKQRQERQAEHEHCFFCSFHRFFLPSPLRGCVREREQS